MAAFVSSIISINYGNLTLCLNHGYFGICIIGYREEFQHIISDNLPEYKKTIKHLLATIGRLSFNLLGRYSTTKLYLVWKVTSHFDKKVRYTGVQYIDLKIYIR